MRCGNEDGASREQGSLTHIHSPAPSYSPTYVNYAPIIGLARGGGMVSDAFSTAFGLTLPPRNEGLAGWVSAC